jgi:nitroreductase/ferredoxin
VTTFKLPLNLFQKGIKLMPQAIVNEGKCTRCGICAAECPIGIIESNGKSVPSLIPEGNEFCVSCGHCLAVCPRGAFSIDGIQPDECTKTDHDSALSAELTNDLIRSRRSIRVYKDTSVPRETFKKLIDTVRYAPTASNSQLVQWLIIDSPDEVRHLAGLSIDYIREQLRTSDTGPRKYRLSNLVKDWDNGIDRIFRGAPALVIAHAPSTYNFATVDCSIALSFLDLAAPSLGLGTCWAGFFMLDVTQWEPLRKKVVLPEGNACFGTMMVGFPKHIYHRIPSRKNASISWR